MDQIRVGQAHIAIVPEGATPQGPMISACPRGRRAFPFPAGRSPAFSPTSHKKRTGALPIESMCYAGPGPFTRRVQSVAAPFCSPRPYWFNATRGATAQFSPHPVPGGKKKVRVLCSSHSCMDSYQLVFRRNHD